MARRLALPLTLSEGRAVTVDQGSVEDLRQSVRLALLTPRGERLWARSFGLAPQRGLAAVDEAAVLQAVLSAEFGVPSDRVTVEVLSGPPSAQVRVRVGDVTARVSL